MSSQSRITIVTAPSGGGKTSYICRNYDGCHGFVTLKSDREGRKLFLRNLATGDERVLMYRGAEWTYIVDDSVFRDANAWLCTLDSGLVVLDECGWMECEGRGFRPALEHFRQCMELECVLSVRLDRLQWYLDFFSGRDVEVVRL